MIELSVIIPAYNEAAAIEANVRLVCQKLDGLKIPYEIILVNDGSTDATLAIINRLKSDAIKIISYTPNQGKGHAVKVGMTNASLFAYVADGKNGLRVLQMMSPDKSADLWGFSPRPEPGLIATYKTRGEALALSKGLDRDRAVDESGNQVAVFGRRGSRPFNLEEMRKLYIRDGKLYTVTNAGGVK